MKDNNCAHALERERERESAIRAPVYLRDYAIPLSRTAVRASKPLLCASGAFFEWNYGYKEIVSVICMSLPLLMLLDFLYPCMQI